MQIGRLDRIISIYTPLFQPDGLGQAPEAPGELVARVWAEATDFRGGSSFIANKVVAEAEIGFLIRYRSDIEAGQWIVFEGDNYEILHVGLYKRQVGLILEGKRVIT